MACATCKDSGVICGWCGAAGALCSCPKDATTIYLESGEACGEEHGAPIKDCTNPYCKTGV